MVFGALSGPRSEMDDTDIDYSVHEAWNEATNVYILAILVSFGLLMYARRNKRKIMRIFHVPQTVGSEDENFFSDLPSVRLRQQLEMQYLSRKVELQQHHHHQQQHQQQQQKHQAGAKLESVMLLVE
uniref:small integral membrane protein 19 isoform X1 n=2 Tax=Myxine glutinosa TaxID=7769 RepID=UPI00358E504F